MLTPLSVLAAVILPLPIHATVEFFLSDVFDRCERNGVKRDCFDNTVRGDLCAHDQAVGETWCCPAPDLSCWSLAKSCQGGNGRSPGRDQISCNAGGSVWCCIRGLESCTQKPGQVNVCVSTFDSPNANVSIEDANQIAASSTAILRAAATAATRSSSSSIRSIADSPSSTASGSITPDSIAASPAVQNLPSTTAKVESSGLSGGSIAGIAIGAVAALALVAAATYWIARRRFAHSTPNNEASEFKGDMSSLDPSQMGTYRAELGTDYQRPVEVEAYSVK